MWIDLQVFTTVNGFLIVCDAVEQLFPEKMLDDLFATLVMEIDKAITDDLSHSDPVESPGAQARRASRAEVASWRLPDTTLVDEVIAAARCHPRPRPFAVQAATLLPTKIWKSKPPPSPLLW